MKPPTAWGWRAQRPLPLRFFPSPHPVHASAVSILLHTLPPSASVCFHFCSFFPTYYRPLHYRVPSSPASLGHLSLPLTLRSISRCALGHSSHSPSTHPTYIPSPHTPLTLFPLGYCYHLCIHTLPTDTPLGQPFSRIGPSMPTTRTPGVSPGTPTLSDLAPPPALSLSGRVSLHSS
ncbi:unnamed protein product [Pleuronectes platessa]|uniref:Uncharacterized protein n=1 Tax=Pleuronectes platessa TaxID=8262 RepID=A0A9N7VGC6_PLEPL|nr:unnamed protein product [Pleuronectes platessa]